jgi:hypothetical protein
MREIRFRAWDRKSQQMLHNVSTGTVVLFGDDGEPTANSYDCDFMQYTGLKDSEQKDVYEGDIVEYEFSLCGMQTGVFIFDDGMFYLKGTGRWRPLDYTVIGNIYENPELLKD